MLTDSKTLPRHIQFGGVYTFRHIQCPEVGGAFDDKRTTHPAPQRQVVSVYNSMFDQTYNGSCKSSHVCCLQSTLGSHVPAWLGNSKRLANIYLINSN